jgi:hypothetical protein
MRDEIGIPPRDLSSRTPQEKQVAIVLTQHGRVVSAYVAAFAGDSKVRDGCLWRLPTAMNFIKRMAVHTFHSGAEMDVRCEPVLLGSIYARRLSPFHEGSYESSFEVPLIKAHIVRADVIGIVTLETRGHADAPNEPMNPRLPFGAIGVGHVTCRAPHPPVLAPTMGTPRVQVAAQARSAQQVVAEAAGD